MILAAMLTAAALSSAPISTSLLSAHTISTACEAATLLPTTQTADLDCAAVQMYTNGASAVTFDFNLVWAAASAVHVYIDTNSGTTTTAAPWATVQRGNGLNPPVVTFAPLDLSRAVSANAAWSMTVKDLESVKWIRIRIVGTGATSDTIAVKASIAAP